MKCLNEQKQSILNLCSKTQEKITSVKALIDANNQPNMIIAQKDVLHRMVDELEQVVLQPCVPQAMNVSISGVEALVELEKFGYVGSMFDLYQLIV